MTDRGMPLAATGGARRCGTCRHWRGLPGSQWKVCDRLGQFPPRLIRLTDVGGLVGVETEAAFGCVLYERHAVTV
jgi:hypothetical protein